MKILYKVIVATGLLGLSACAYDPIMGGYGRSNGYYRQNPNYGYQGYGYPASGGNYGYRGYGNSGYGYGNQGYGNYGGYQQPQYGRGRHHGNDD